MKKMKYANAHLRLIILIYISICVAVGTIFVWMVFPCAEDIEGKIVVLLLGAIFGIFYPVYNLTIQNFILFGKYTFDAEKVTFKLGKRVYSIKWESGVDAGLVPIRVGRGVNKLYFYISTEYQDRKKRTQLTSLARQKHHQDIIYFDFGPDELPEIIEYLPASIKPQVIYDALRYDLSVKHEAE